MVPRNTAVRLALACGSLALASAQGVPGTDCCHGTDPANTCYAWFQDAVNVCLGGAQPRDSCDCHEPRDSSGQIALSMEECCVRNCFTEGFTDATCPDGTRARGEHDWHQPGWTQHADGTWGPGEFSEQECCQRNCWMAGFTDATCPDGTTARGEHDWHQPPNFEFTAQECCHGAEHVEEHVGHQPHAAQCKFGHLMETLQHAVDTQWGDSAAAAAYLTADPVVVECMRVHQQMSDNECGP